MPYINFAEEAYVHVDKTGKDPLCVFHTTRAPTHSYVNGTGAGNDDAVPLSSFAIVPVMAKTFLPERSK